MSSSRVLTCYLPPSPIMSFGVFRSEWDKIIKGVIQKQLMHLANGANGALFLYKHKDTFYAVKVLLNEAELKKFILRESQLLLGKQSAHLTTIYGSCATQSATYIFMEYINGISLDVLLNWSKELGITIDLSTKKRVLYQIAQGLCELHSWSLSHRDLKLENVLVSVTGEIKITDFGRITEKERANSLCGTPQYMPPEVIAGFFEEPIEYSPIAVDLWTFGCLIVELLLGYPPFQDEGVGELGAAIGFVEPEESIVEVEKSDSDLAVLVKKLLDKNPQERLKHFPEGFTTVLENKAFQSVAGDEELNARLARNVLSIQHSIEERKATIFTDF